MKNYILMLGVAGVALSSYAACATNSATMTVTATIAHDVSLTKTGDISLGTITINPAYTGTMTFWDYNDSGVISYRNQGAIVSAPNATVGTFTANIPNPEACSNETSACGGLQFRNHNDIQDNFFGGDNGENHCDLYIKYSGTGNIFKVIPMYCTLGEVSSVTPGEHEGMLTISYTPS
ncbi:MAG: hypothetical protein IJ689_07315 [Alphaproteobacteria bacterium]|nr:hypothetical protein [Alphaproteobacteria bacterium]